MARGFTRATVVQRRSSAQLANAKAAPIVEAATMASTKYQPNAVRILGWCLRSVKASLRVAYIVMVVSRSQ